MNSVGSQAPQRTPWLTRPMLGATGLGLMHACVDASTVSALFRTTRVVDMARWDAFTLVLTYNLVAFGLQPLVGWLSDRFSAKHATLLGGLLLPMMALAAHAHSPWLTVAAASLGNAMFHVGAGTLILELGTKRTAPAGIFVGPGALGLGFGLWYGKSPAAGPLWPLILVLVLAALGHGLAWRHGRATRALGSTPPRAAAERLASNSRRPLGAEGLVGIASVALLLSVAVRALTGGAILRGCTPSLLLLLGAPLAAFSGKVLGGFVADRVGWFEATALALLVSTPLMLTSPTHPGVLLLGMMTLQMTMPVTLVAMSRALPTLPGVAFGLPCLALAIGSLPGTFHSTQPLIARPLLLGWNLLALVAVTVGLWLLGVRLRRLPSLDSHKDALA